MNGSLLIECKMPLGHLDDENLLHFSSQAGKCILQNVSVLNEGIDRSKKNVYWKNRIEKKECLKIQLNRNSEFYAKDVVFKSTAIQKPTWQWKYSITQEKLPL